jgi:hypothetical protein
MTKLKTNIGLRATQHNRMILIGYTLIKFTSTGCRSPEVVNLRKTGFFYKTTERLVLSLKSVQSYFYFQNQLSAFS